MASNPAAHPHLLHPAPAPGPGPQLGLGQAAMLEQQRHHRRSPLPRHCPRGWNPCQRRWLQLAANSPADPAQPATRAQPPHCCPSIPRWQRPTPMAAQPAAARPLRLLQAGPQFHFGQVQPARDWCPHSPPCHKHRAELRARQQRWREGGFGYTSRDTSRLGTAWSGSRRSAETKQSATEPRPQQLQSRR